VCAHPGRLSSAQVVSSSESQAGRQGALLSRIRHQPCHLKGAPPGHPRTRPQNTTSARSSHRRVPLAWRQMSTKPDPGAVDVLVVAEHGWCPVVVRLRRGGSAGAAGDDRIAAGKLPQVLVVVLVTRGPFLSEAAPGLVDQRHRPCHSREATASLASASAQCRWPVPPPSRNHGRTGELRLWFWQESPGRPMRYPAGAATTPTRRRGLSEAPSH
jgi:hypothetical protein